MPGAGRGAGAPAGRKLTLGEGDRVESPGQHCCDGGDGDRARGTLCIPGETRRSRRFTEVSEKCDAAAVAGTACTEATWQAKERRGIWEFPGCLSPRPRVWAVSEDSCVETLGCTKTFRVALPACLLTLLDCQPCEVRATSSPREYCSPPVNCTRDNVRRAELVNICPRPVEQSASG